MRQQPTPSFKQLCVMAHHVMDRLGPTAESGDVVDALKTACAKARLNYDTAPLVQVFDAVQCARAKGYRTPRRRRVA